MKWFRLHSNLIHDPKIQRMQPSLRWHWIAILCVANEQEPRGYIPDVPDIAFALRISEAAAAKVVGELLKRGLIDLDDAGRMRPHNWDARQFASDVRETPGRKLADESRRKVDGIWVNHAANSRRNRGELAATDTEAEQTQIRTDPETEADAEDAPAHPFALTYVRRFQERHAGQRPPQTEHAAALAIEREYGPSACIQLGNDLDWSKHPNYMRPILEERRNGNSNRNDRRVDATSANPGLVAVGVSDLERRRAFVAERRRASES